MRLTILFIFAFCSISYAQITLDSNILPKVGDRVTNTLTNISGVDLHTEEADNVYWNFKNIEGGREVIQEYRTIPEEYKATFPDATMYVDALDGVQRFFSIEDDNLIELGLSGLALGQFVDISSGIRYNGKNIALRSSMEFGDSYMDEYAINFKESSDKMPDEIKQYLVNFGADSVEVELGFNTMTTIDGYGVLGLPKEKLDVLRANKSSIVTPIFSAKLPFFGWTAIDLNTIPQLEQYSEFFAPRTIDLYEFYSEKYSGPTATVTLQRDSMDNITPTQILYATDQTVPTQDIKVTQKEISVFPNPTYGNIEINLSNYPADKYYLEIYNIIGKKIQRIDFKNDEPRLKTDLSHLQKGTYLYSIFNGKGKKLTTRRLVIMSI